MIPIWWHKTGSINEKCLQNIYVTSISKSYLLTLLIWRSVDIHLSSEKSRVQTQRESIDTHLLILGGLKIRIDSIDFEKMIKIKNKIKASPILDQ